MPHIQGIFRQQLQVVPLEEPMSQDHPVRFIDTFMNRMRQRGSCQLEWVRSRETSPQSLVLRTLFYKEDFAERVVTTLFFIQISYNFQSNIFQ
jgi:hypothetical protein